MELPRQRSARALNDSQPGNGFYPSGIKQWEGEGSFALCRNCRFCLRTETSPGFYGHRPPQWISPPTDGEQAKLSPELPTPCVRATMRNDDGAAPRMSKTVRVIANRCTGTFRLSTWSIRYRRAGAWATRLGRVRRLEAGLSDSVPAPLR